MSFKTNPNRKSYRGRVVTQIKGQTKGSKALAKAAATSATTSTGTTGYWGHGNYASTYQAPKFKPISDEVTVYGATKFRAPRVKDEFVGFRGEPILAGVLDIDGTMQTFGQGLDKDLLKWVEKVQKDNPDMVWLVITARDHGTFGYDTSFNWVMRHFPYPFAAMVARPKTDPRYASEFKREVAQGWEDMGLYQIIAAADDNSWVIKMWKQWAIDHFEEPKDFELFEASYGSYADWRSDLPSKGRSYTSTVGGYTDPHKNEVWIRSTQGADGKWSQAHWAIKGSKEHKDQEASDKAKYGNSTPPMQSYGKDPVDGVWKSTALHGRQPRPGEDIANDKAWAVYFTRRDDAGAYLAPDFTTGPSAEDDDHALNYFIERDTMELWVAKEHPALTPDDIANMSPTELWASVDMDYEEELIDAVHLKFLDVFSSQELRQLEVSELEELIALPTEDEAMGYVDAILKYVDNFGSTFKDLDREDGASSERKDLEQEVYANSDLAEADIANMDTDVLRGIIAHNNMLNDLDEEGIEMPPTGELSVAEVLEAVGHDATDDVLDEAEAIIARYDHPDQLLLNSGDDEAQAGVA